MRLVSSGQVTEVRALMDGGTGRFNAGCHSMNAALINLLRDKCISMDDARNATTDRLGFADACYSAMLDGA